MTFQEYISALPLEDLKLIASTLEIRPGMISRARLIRELPEQIFQPGFIESRVDALNEAEQNLLLAILFAGEQGYAFDPGKSGDGGTADHLYALLSRSLIMGRRGQYRMIEYIIPTDIRDILNRHVSRQIAERLAADGPPTDSADELMIIRDLFALVNNLHYEPARLTDKGVLYKRALEHLLSRFELKDDEVSSTALNNYPDRFDLILHYCHVRRLVYAEDARLHRSTAFEQWLHLPVPEKLDDLLAFWYSRNQALSPLAATLLGVLQLCIDLDGIKLGPMLELAVTCVPGLSRRDAALEAANQNLKKALKELAWLGLVRPYDIGDTACLAITPLGKSVVGNRNWTEEGIWAEQFIVQPTFEIIVPKNLSLIIREELERFADLTAVDVTSTYRITQETIYRAGDEGMSGEAVIAFLERHSEKAVPQNVEYSIRSWGETYGQVFFMDVFLLRTETAEIASHIKAHRELSPYIRGEVAPDALIVERHEYRELMDLLRKHGYMPRSQVIGMEQEGKAGIHSFAREYFADVRNRHTSLPAPKSVIGFNDCLPGYRLRKQLNSSTENAPHFEQAATMQYLSSKQTEELLDMAVNYNQIAVVDYYLGNRSRSYMHRIRPIRIERTRGAPYVEARRIPEDDVRTFKIAHIKAIRIVYDEDEDDLS